MPSCSWLYRPTSCHPRLRVTVLSLQQRLPLLRLLELLCYLCDLLLDLGALRVCRVLLLERCELLLRGPDMLGELPHLSSEWFVLLRCVIHVLVQGSLVTCHQIVLSNILSVLFLQHLKGLIVWWSSALGSCNRLWCRKRRRHHLLIRLHHLHGRRLLACYCVLGISILLDRRWNADASSRRVTRHTA